MAGMPQEMSPEAREIGVMIDGLVEEVLTEAGLPRRIKSGAAAKTFGLLVQHAIDEYLERIAAQRADA